MDDHRPQRRAAIEAAAYELLAERGFAGTSMLAIARKARASNETLYAWYGDKRGLFRAMVESNAEAAAARLRDTLAGGADLRETLAEFGAALLQVILSDRAISLNRVAAADLSGETGRILGASGRGRILPELAGAIARLTPELDGAEAERRAALFLRLLIGDSQIRRVIGVTGAPTPEECDTLAKTAVTLFLATLSGLGGRVP